MERQQPPMPNEDYEAIEAAVMDTARGRWFLAEFARRNRNADTALLLDAIDRIEGLVGLRQAPAPLALPAPVEEQAAIAAPLVEDLPAPFAEPEVAVDPEPTAEPEAAVDPEPIVEPEAPVDPEPIIEAAADPEPIAEPFIPAPVAVVEPASAFEPPPAIEPPPAPPAIEPVAAVEIERFDPPTSTRRVAALIANIVPIAPSPWHDSAMAESNDDTDETELFDDVGWASVPSVDTPPLIEEIGDAELVAMETSEDVETAEPDVEEPPSTFPQTAIVETYDLDPIEPVAEPLLDGVANISFISPETRLMENPAPPLVEAEITPLPSGSSPQPVDPADIDAMSYELKSVYFA